MPNFLIIGAPRSGTTSLYHYLGQHPQIYMSPVKEPRFFLFEDGRPAFDTGAYPFFLRHSVHDIEAYQQLFRDARAEIAVGEATPTYLSSLGCAPRIARHLPDAKLIAILRNPADRAFSSWSRRVREGEETLSFEEALAAGEEPSVSGNQRGMYRRAGFYHQHLAPYFEAFDRSQIRVVLFEDLGDAASLSRSIYQFLGVDDSFPADFSIRHNASGRPRRLGLQNLLTKPHPVKDFLKQIVPERWGHRVIELASSRNLQPLSLNRGTRQRLLEGYRADIGRLERLLDRDLSHWLKDAAPAGP